MAKNFKEIIRQDKPTLVDFYATWCGPCKVLSPIVQEIKNEYAGEVNVLKVDVEQEGKISKKYNIFSVPTLILFKNGEIIWRVAGVRSKRDIAKVLDKALGKQAEEKTGNGWLSRLFGKK